MEEQAVSDIALVLDTPTLSVRILAGSWPTLKSSTSLTFSSLRQAIGSFVSLQYNTAGNAYVVSDGDNFVYPMPSFESRVTDTEDTGGTTTNNYFGDDNCDEGEWAVALTLTAIFCLLGGIAIGAGLFYCVMSKSSSGAQAGGGLSKQEASSSSL